MKVGELIDVLLNYHEDLPVYLADWNEDYREPIELDVKEISERDGKVVLGE